MKRYLLDKVVVSALREIAAQNGGRLSPEQVVEAARAETSPLHNRFTWDDTHAAQQWRLHEARNLINVVVEYLPGARVTDPVRVFVSLRADRGVGGYRVLANVVTDRQRYQQLLAEALDDLEALRTKYARLRELGPVFAAIDRIAKRRKKAG